MSSEQRPTSQLDTSVEIPQTCSAVCLLQKQRSGHWAFTKDIIIHTKRRTVEHLMVTILMAGVAIVGVAECACVSVYLSWRWNAVMS